VVTTMDASPAVEIAPATTARANPSNAAQCLPPRKT
jgi:hypothetical protein